MSSFDRMTGYNAIAAQAEALKRRSFAGPADPATELFYFQIARQDIEGWSAKELARQIGYKWDAFLPLLLVSRAAMGNVGFEVDDHFTQQVNDWKLSRSAAYICLMNCDPKNAAVAYMRSHFYEPRITS